MTEWWCFRADGDTPCGKVASVFGRRVVLRRACTVIPAKSLARGETVISLSAKFAMLFLVVAICNSRQSMDLLEVISEHSVVSVGLVLFRVCFSFSFSQLLVSRFFGFQAKVVVSGSTD